MVNARLSLTGHAKAKCGAAFANLLAELKKRGQPTTKETLVLSGISFSCPVNESITLTISRRRSSLSQSKDAPAVVVNERPCLPERAV